MARDNASHLDCSAASLFAAGGGEPVVAGALPLFGEIPGCGDPAFRFEAVKGRIEGAGFDLQEVFHLFALFRRKCGYCESFVEHVSPGAVDHYRPKSTYARLAYEITNYIPSCTGCNSGGKGSKFPVVGGAHTPVPGGEKKERPLLLNPWRRRSGFAA